MFHITLEIQLGGGTEQYIHLLLSILKKNKYTIEEYCLDVENKRDTLALKVSHPIYFSNHRLTNNGYGKKDFILYKKIKKDLDIFKQQHTYDLIINNICECCSFEKFLSNEIVIQHQDLKFYNFSYWLKKFRKFRLFFEKKFSKREEVFKKVKNIVFFNNESKKEIEDYYKKHFTVSPCIPLAEYTKNKISSFKKGITKNRICYIGRVEQNQKNIKFLIKLAKYLDVSIDVYGAGPLVGKIKNAINIKYCGKLDHKDVLKTFAKYKASIIVSKFEGFPYSCLESICAQTPCIIRDTFTNAKFFTNNHKGLLLDENLSPKQCAEKINKWLEKNNFSKAAKLNKEFALNNLTLEVFNDKWDTFLQEFKRN